MADEEYYGQDSFALLSEFNTKLRDLEEKQKILKDRTLLIGQNLLDSRDEINEKIVEMKKDILLLQSDVIKLKRLVQRLSEESEHYARRQEVDMLQSQAKIFDPLRFVTVEDVEKVVDKKLKKLRAKK